ncbi:MAG: GTP cyclohydrolase I FolE2 [Armatimonadetes bacterium]|nr:GTP cyclohydrolase I FolE2 [Armatimonadota bacterium]
MFDPPTSVSHNDVAIVTLPDIQKTPDQRNIPIDRVGVRQVKFPIRVLERDNGEQQTIGNFTLTVDLPSEFKGTHMSRFMEVLNETSHCVSVDGIPKILEQLKERLHSASAHLDVTFPFFMVKPAPVTKKEGMMEYTCGFRATSDTSGVGIEMFLEVPVATLCPCSKEISQYGAHNQRGIVTVTLNTEGMVWLEEVIEMIESVASAPLFPVLKRPDEKWVTEHAYENPRFVEDMVREVAMAFDSDSRIRSYTIEVENQESIHAHNAYACLSRTKS